MIATYRHLTLRVIASIAALLVAATLAVASASDASAADPSEAEIVLAYAPQVRLHPNERFLPMNASRFVELSELRWSHARGCRDHRVAREGQVDAAKLGSGGYRDKALTSGLPFCNVGGRSYNSQELTRPFDKDNPIPNQPEGFFLELPNGERGGHLPTAPVYYEYIERKSVTFWFFYGFNDAPGGFAADHEGDWEKISVQLSSKNNRAQRVALFQHEGHCIVDYKDLTTPESRGHPVVYSAIGSHATYPRAGSFRIRVPNLPDQTDRTANGGPLWKTYEREADVKQPWYNFGGAWGEVGGTIAGAPLGQAARTGPLGPRDVAPVKLGAPSNFNGPRCA